MGDKWILPTAADTYCYGLQAAAVAHREPGPQRAMISSAGGTVNGSAYFADDFGNRLVMVDPGYGGGGGGAGAL